MNPLITTQPAFAPTGRRRITLTQWILVAMVAGVLFGWSIAEGWQNEKLPPAVNHSKELEFNNKLEPIIIVFA